MYRRLLHVQRRGVFIVFLYVLLTYFACRNAVFPGLVDYLVINVCKVLDEFYFVARIFKIPSESVKYHEGPGVSDVKEIIHSRSAYVYFDLVLIHWNELFFFSCKCVVNFHDTVCPFVIVINLYLHSLCQTFYPARLQSVILHFPRPLRHENPGPHRRENRLQAARSP